MKIDITLRDLRLARGRAGRPYRLREIAAISALSLSHVAKIERGIKRPTTSFLDSLSELYTIPLDVLAQAASATAREAEARASAPKRRATDYQSHRQVDRKNSSGQYFS